MVIKSKSTEEIRNLIGKGASVLIGRSLWGTAKEEFGKIQRSNKLNHEMIKEFINFYGKNILKESVLINGVENFLKWCKGKKYFNGCLYKQTRTSCNRFA